MPDWHRADAAPRVLEHERGAHQPIDRARARRPWNWLKEGQQQRPERARQQGGEVQRREAHAPERRLEHVAEAETKYMLKARWIRAGVQERRRSRAAGSGSLSTTGRTAGRSVDRPYEVVEAMRPLRPSCLPRKDAGR